MSIKNRRRVSLGALSGASSELWVDAEDSPGVAEPDCRCHSGMEELLSSGPVMVDEKLKARSRRMGVGEKRLEER